MTFYTCPVCAFTDMTDPIEEGNICPCCGTEFGYDDDLGVTYTQLRNRWIEHGMQWFSTVTLPTLDWDPVRQLIEADYEFDGKVEDERETLTVFTLEVTV